MRTTSINMESSSPNERQSSGSSDLNLASLAGKTSSRAPVYTLGSRNLRTDHGTTSFVTAHRRRYITASDAPKNSRTLTRRRESGLLLEGVAHFHTRILQVTLELLHLILDRHLLVAQGLTRGLRHLVAQIAQATLELLHLLTGGHVLITQGFARGLFH